MTRTARQRLAATASIVAAVIPFAFGIIRAVTTGSDLRYMWVALGAGLGQALVLALGGVFTRAPKAGPVALSLIVFLASATAAGLTAMGLGTTLNPGLLVVAVGFGACCAMSALLFVRARA